MESRANRTVFWWRNIKERDRLVDLGTEWWIPVYLKEVWWE